MVADPSHDVAGTRAQLGERPIPGRIRACKHGDDTHLGTASDQLARQLEGDRRARAVARYDRRTVGGTR